MLAILISVAMAGPVLTQGVSEVGNYVFTSREVQISQAMASFESLKKPVTKASFAKLDFKSWFASPGDEAFRAHLNQIMTEQLVKSEAESFSVVQVPQAEIHKEAEEMQQWLADLPEWKKLEVKPNEMEQILTRRKIANQFLKFKMDSSGVFVSDEDVRVYFEKNKAKFGSNQLALFKDSIKEALAQKQLEEKLKDWFEALKRKHRVRFLKPQDAS